MENLINDIRYGIRSLLKHPGFTLIAIVTLAFPARRATEVVSLLALRYD